MNFIDGLAGNRTLIADVSAAAKPGGPSPGASDSEAGPAFGDILSEVSKRGGQAGEASSPAIPTTETPSFRGPASVKIATAAIGEPSREAAHAVDAIQAAPGPGESTATPPMRLDEADGASICDGSLELATRWFRSDADGASAVPNCGAGTEPRRSPRAGDGETSAGTTDPLDGSRPQQNSLLSQRPHALATGSSEVDALATNRLQLGALAKKGVESRSEPEGASPGALKDAGAEIAPTNRAQLRAQAKKGVDSSSEPEGARPGAAQDGGQTIPPVALEVSTQPPLDPLAPSPTDKLASSVPSRLQPVQGTPAGSINPRPAATAFSPGSTATEKGAEPSRRVASVASNAEAPLGLAALRAVQSGVSKSRSPDSFVEAPTPAIDISRFDSIPSEDVAVPVLASRPERREASAGLERFGAVAALAHDEAASASATSMPLSRVAEPTPVSPLSAPSAQSSVKIVVLDRRTHLPPAMQASPGQQIADRILTEIGASLGGVAEGAEASESPNPAQKIDPDKKQSSLPSSMRSVDLQLEPASLGAITIRMRLSGVRLEIQVETSGSDAMRALNDDKDRLADRLRVAGYVTDNVVVKVAEPQTAQMQHAPTPAQAHASQTPGEPGWPRSQDGGFGADAQSGAREDRVPSRGRTRDDSEDRACGGDSGGAVYL